MFISFKQKIPAEKVVKMYISKLNTEMTDISRQL